MANNYKHLLMNQLIPGRPIASYDALKKKFVHIYQNITLQTSIFQKEVANYLNRKESYSGHVAAINKIKDEHITYYFGKAAMEISIVTDYVPWRLHVEKIKLYFEQALFILRGACKGFRELLHRVKFPFLIQDSMIGIDGNGNVKVWWNEAFYKSNFGFTMTANIKLREMVKSLMQVILNKMEVGQTYRLQLLLSSSLETFATLQEGIQAIFTGINLDNVGRKLVSDNEEHIFVINQCKHYGSIKENSIMDSSRLSRQSIRAHFSSEKMILSPRKTEPLQFSRKVITKRTYRDGTSPDAHQKMKIIKEDIEKLRSIVDKNEPIQTLQQARLRSSRSVESLFSIRKGLTGDTTIPEIKKIIKESEVIEKEDDIAVSRFVEPIVQSTTSILYNPESYSPYKQSQMRREEMYHNNSQFLYKLQSLMGHDKSVNSTSRSIGESRMEKIISTEASKQRFGESEKKIPQSGYFTSFFET